MTQIAVITPVAQGSPRIAFANKYGRYKDLCAALNISRTTLWRWIEQPGFPKPLKKGNTVLFDIEAVEAWLEGGGI